MSISATEVKYKYMRKWYEFLRTLETGGGTIIILLILSIMFLILISFQVPIPEIGRLLDMVIGALLMILKGSFSSNDSHVEKEILKSEGESNNNEQHKTDTQVL